MEKCNCGREFEKMSSLQSHARFCKEYVKITQEKKTSYVCECGKAFDKGQSLNGHYSRCVIHRNGILPTKKNTGWKINEQSRKKGGETYSNRVLNNEIIPSFRNKHHSIETRELISSKMSEKNNGYIKTKYYEIFSAYTNKLEKVQGTWELKFAEKLNELNISWEKCSDKKINYIKDRIHKKYIPDFYLPDRNLFIEIKGFWFKSKDGRIDDKLKMELVIDQNEDLNIQILDTIEKISNFK